MISRIGRIGIAAICVSLLGACATKPVDTSQSGSSGTTPTIIEILTPASLGTVGLLSMPLAALPKQPMHERAGAFDGFGTCAGGFAATIIGWAGAIYVCPWIVPLGNLVDRPARPPAKDRELLEVAFRGASAERHFHDRVLAHVRSNANTEMRDLGAITARSKAKIDEESRSAEKPVQTALEIALLPVALVASGAKNDPHVDLWIVVRARLVRVADRHVLADEQIDALISNPVLVGSQSPGEALLRERTEEIQSTLDRLAAQVVSRVLPQPKPLDAVASTEAQPDSAQNRGMEPPDIVE